MKTAIASSGLGHVARGVEAWAAATAAALAEKGVEFSAHEINLMTGEQHDPDYIMVSLADRRG